MSALDDLELPLGRKRKKKESGDEWVLSFADVVTVLLCFFILFYMIEKQFEKEYGFGTENGRVQDFPTALDTPEFQKLLLSMEKNPDVTIVKTETFLEIHFPPEIFFASGSTRLTKNGKKAIDEVLAPLKTIKKDYYLQIQGFSDSQKVKKHKDRWWQDNMQLSLARALGVYYYLIEQGVEKQILNVAGYGTHKPDHLKEKDFQRRISLKFEPAKLNLGGKDEL